MTDAFCNGGRGGVVFFFFRDLNLRFLFFGVFYVGGALGTRGGMFLFLNLFFWSSKSEDR